MSDIRSRVVVIDGIRTHWWEAGEGPTVVLLHAGGYGENAWMSWSRNIAALAERFRVMAPDWLGFGRTDKVRDFARGNARTIDHMVRTFAALDITEADVIGLSMGGTFLVKIAATEHPALPIRRMVLVSGGGFAPLNDARRALQDYDGTFEGMRTQLRQVIHAPLWEDDDFVRPYYEASMEPGQFEFVSSPRLRSPFAAGRGDFGGEDTTPYELVAVPTLLTAGAQDRLREPGYAHAIGARIAGSEVVVFDPCGHCPNVERAEEWNAAVLDFLSR